MSYETLFWMIAPTGVGLIVFGGLLLLIRSNMREETMTFQLGKIKIAIGKGGVSTGIVCMLFGLVLLFLAWSLVVGGAPAAGSVSLTPTVLAQEHPDQPVRQSDRAWAYLGPAGEPSEWSFSTLILVPDSGIEILRARKPVDLYADHYGAWTGSPVGTLLRSPVPEVVREIPAGGCVYVRSREIIGLGNIWLNVKPLECDPVQEALGEVASAVNAGSSAASRQMR